jgi:putative membrane protein
MKRGWLAVPGAVAAAGIGWACYTAWSEIAGVGRGVWIALWCVPLLIGVHFVQLLLSSIAWRDLFTEPRANVVVYFRLRLIREGIDSLFPVAQIGGEVVGARMLATRGIEAAASGASVIVDVSLEVVSQFLFLSAGVATLAAVAGPGHTGEWLAALAIAAVAAGGFLLAQRFGLLRAIEWLVDRIAGQFPDLAGLSLGGLHAATRGFYRRRPALWRATLLHFLSWSLGAVETWIVLAALGIPVSLPVAFAIDSLGMAARTAGFAVPGALAIQEGGFALAALSVGLPESAGLSLSLIKRVREVLVGVAGVSLAWFDGGFGSRRPNGDDATAD